jgi:hypothetical protein
MTKIPAIQPLTSIDLETVTGGAAAWNTPWKAGAAGGWSGEWSGKADSAAPAARPWSSGTETR